MAGIVWFLFWQLFGVLLSYILFHKKRLTVRLWLGSVLGSVSAIWLPIPFSFFLGFSVASHLCALLTGVLILIGLLLYARKSPRPESETPDGTDKPFAFLFAAFFALAVWLILNHTFTEGDGNLYTGQCTYGDMCMHFGFITSIVEQRYFPPYYNILPYELVCYPFLCDSVSSSLYLLGTSLRWAYMFPMFFAFAQTFCGVWFLACEVCKKRAAAVTAFLLFFLNGGFGMIYFTGEYTLHDLFTGFYETPTNLIDKNMRWVNVIADMMLPQRATLFGWSILFAVLYLLFLAVWRGEHAFFLPAGILGGLLPMIHTHSFFALGLVAACWLVASLVRDGWNRRWLTDWLLFGFSAVILASPQVFFWTLRSVGGNESFLRFNWDWVNGGEENWLWFWVRNVGIVFLITPIAFFTEKKEDRAIFSGAILIFVICELIVFQPNVYDNNKLLYVGYLFACMLSAKAVCRWLDGVNRSSLRAVLMSLLLLLGCNAGLFTLGREVYSGTISQRYQLFSSQELAAADFIRENTDREAMFLTANNHDNTVAVLTGRNIVCGSASYVYFHGLDYMGQQRAETAMLTDAEVLEACREVYGLDYVYISSYERSLGCNLSGYLAERYPLVFSAGDIEIYDIR